MSTLEALILGFIQGATEFLPVSSSGHLVIVQNLLNISEGSLLFDVILHAGTFLATLIVFRKRVFALILSIPRMPLFLKTLFQKGHLAIGDDPNAWLLLLICFSTLITGSIGVLFHDFFEETFSSLRIVSITLFLTGLFLFLARNFDPKKGKTPTRTSIKDAVLVGFAQALAILPGLSRSGTTISSGLFLGFSREFAGEYSFLISLPAIFGAICLEASKISSTMPPWQNIALGFISSFVVGIFCLKLLLRWIRQGKLIYFTFYCWFMSFICILISLRI
ncbi:MAG: undecaprenyl-diphosphate phosphatase [Bdellovibrionales bacterium]|nr:undecaprenyl-diphosphate phosphatase [Bdellovibrionales bacterium]